MRVPCVPSTAHSKGSSGSLKPFVLPDFSFVRPDSRMSDGEQPRPRPLLPPGVFGKYVSRNHDEDDPPAGGPGRNHILDELPAIAVERLLDALERIQDNLERLMDALGRQPDCLGRAHG